MLVRSGFLRFRLVLVASLALSGASPASDCDGDGAPDEEEVAAGAPDCNGNGIPDACDLIGTMFGVAEAARIPSGVIFALDAGDLDGDGAGDVAACSSEGVSVFLQRPAGEFELRTFPSPGCNGLRASDLDGDGDLDLALDTSVIVVLENSGAGVFDITAGHGAQTGHAQTTPVDMDADGDVDLVSIARDGTGLSILFNAGDGTYPSQARLGADLFPSQFAVSDLDVDGDPDLAILSQALLDVVLLLNTDGRGAFGTPTTIPLDLPTSGLLAAELDGSGTPELLVYSFNPGRLCILRREGAGFTRDCRLTGGDHASLLHASDLTSDGIPDVLLVETNLTCATPSASLFTNVAAGGPRRPMTADIGFVNGPVIVRDVIGDSIPEITTSGDSLGQAIRILRLGPGPPLSDCDRSGIPDECELAGSDWNFNFRLDACEIEEGLADCDRNGIPDAQDPDCDRNGVPDVCDIAAAARQDVDADGVPDDCEPLRGSLVDCNGNGVSDETDLGSSTSADCNANLVPDECDIRRYHAALRTRLPVDGLCLALVLPDLDGNGAADAAVLRAADFSGTHLARKTSLLLYRNGASWSPGRDFPAGILPSRLLSGDLDGNGIEDLLVLEGRAKCLSPGFASAFLARGDGDLAPPRAFAQGLRATSATTGDLDGDGDLDAALAGEEDGNEVFVFLNDGAGRFERAAADIGLPGAPSDLIASDFDGDSDLDLAVGIRDPASVAVFRHSAGAGFTAGPVLRASFAPVRIAAADLEGTGSMDIVSAAGPIEANAAFLFENDAGDFGDERIVDLPVSAKTVHAFDADADGIDDLAVAGPFIAPDISPDGEDLLFLRSRGGREFDAPVVLGKRIIVAGLAIGDTDADGDLDLGAADTALPAIRFFRNGGAQGFEGDFRHAVGDGISALIASDLDRNGTEDIVVAGVSTRHITVLPGANGRVTGGHSTALEFAPQTVAAADLDGDGDGDLVAGGETRVQALFREGDGSHQPGRPAFLGSTPLHVVTSDLDGDGDLDVATANFLPGSGFDDNASVIENDGAGGLGVPRNFAIGMHPRSLCAADLDSDGDTDLVASSVDSGLSFLWNDGTGDFSRADTRPSAETRGLLAVDLDGDGLKELIGARLSDVAILENAGGGAFVERSIPVRGDAWSLEANWYGFAGADLEDDGDLDLVIADFTRLFILENRGGAFPSIPEIHRWRPQDGSGASGSPSPEPSLHIALPHLDGNGHRDFAFAFPFGIEVLILLDSGPVSRDLDRNGVPDECSPAGAPFRRGETNGDGLLDLSDAISVLRWLFAEGAGIPCLEAADGNDDGRVDLSDPVWLLRHLFLGASPPYDPFLSCGVDPTPDALGCVSFPECEG